MLGAFLSLERGAIRWTRRLALVGGWVLLATAVVTVRCCVIRSRCPRLAARR